MDGHLGPGFPRQQDEAGIGHDQGIWLHGHDGRQVANEGFDLPVMRQDIGGQKKRLAQSMRLGDAQPQILFQEIVVPNPKAVSR